MDRKKPTDRQIDIHTETDRQSLTDRDRQTDSHRQTDRQTDMQTTSKRVAAF
jgi:hypothetical protein